jgi:hypothetical protein
MRERPAGRRLHWGISTAPACSQRAVMSVDAFWMVLNKSAALCEMARIVGHGGRLAMTTWVPRLDELENMLRTAGFRLISSAQTPRWRERQMPVYRGILRNRVPLEQEIGPGAAAVMVAEARDAPARLSGAPRRPIVAERQA